MAEEEKTKEKKAITRRELLRSGVRGACLVGLGGGAGLLVGRPTLSEGFAETVWQTDPDKCIACGNCATYCVLKPSAVKCIHAIRICGYCLPCFGYFVKTPGAYTPGAENELCPVDALKRKHIEGQFHEYTVDEEACTACGKCVKGCRISGNGSLYLQVRHDRCVNCSQCSIAEACPSGAFVRLPASDPYIKPKIKTHRTKPKDKAT